MRLLHVHDLDPATGFGGAEVYLQRLIAAQRGRGHEVEVQWAEAGRGRVRDLWDAAALRRLRSRARVWGPDVVHVHGFVRELSPSVLRPTGVPTVVTFHDLRLFGGSEHRLPDPRAVAGRLWVAPVALRLCRAVAAVTGVSDEVTAILRERGLPRPSTLVVPVPAPEVVPEPVSLCRDVLFAGRLSADKGPEVLARAFALIADRHPDSRLLFAGDGPLASALGAMPHVTLLGRLSSREVSKVMGRARVVVVPSLPALRREGSSLTLVEAARHGRPVIGSDDPAVAEVARRLGGDVVRAGDATALAVRLEHWLSQPTEAERLGAAMARVAAEVHDPLAVADAADVVYRSVMRP